MERELKITGVGSVSIEPEITIIKLSVKGKSYVYEEAVSRLNEQVLLIHQVLEKNGLDKNKLRTNDYFVNEKFSEYKRNEDSVFLGFEACHDLSIEFPIDNQLISNTLSGLMKNISGLSFSIDFAVADKESYKKQLIQKATFNAIQSAENIAKAANITLKEIISIEFDDTERYFSGMDRMIRVRLPQNSASPMPEISPKKFNAEKTIMVIWRIE